MMWIVQVVFTGGGGHISGRGRKEEHHFFDIQILNKSHLSTMNANGSIYLALPLLTAQHYHTS